jgi:hypothetical protein
MSIELHGVDPSIEQATIISTGWQKFLEIFERIMGNKRHPAALFLRKTLRNKTKQPEMPAGLTIPEIVEYVRKRSGQVCNQSVGGGILEILGYFKQP